METPIRVPQESIHRTEVRALIAEAFPMVPPPQGRPTLCGREGDDVAAAYGGRNWWECDRSSLLEHPSSLSFLRPDFFAYYLPAILSLSAEDEDYFADAYIPSIVFHLTDPEIGAEISPRLTAEQRQAVAKIIDLLSDDLLLEEELAAVERWGRQ